MRIFPLIPDRVNMPSKSLKAALTTLAILYLGNTAALGRSGDAAYPTRPLRLIVPYAPGGGGDIIARLVGAKLTEAWGQPVINDNRPGGGTLIGTELAAKAVPDGYTLLLGTNALTVNESLHRNLPYNLTRDLAPVTVLIQSPNILLIHPSVPATNLTEFIAWAKTRPGQFNYSSSGNGSTGHL